MTPHDPDTALDRLLAASDPVHGVSPQPSAAALRLRETLMTDHNPHSTPPRRTRRWIGVALVPVAVAATVIAVAVGTGLVADRGSAATDPAAGVGEAAVPMPADTTTDPTTEATTEAVPAADQPYDGIPQLLITEPGWTTTRLTHMEYDGKMHGEWQADNGQLEAKLSWYPGDIDRSMAGSDEYREVTPPAEVVGGPARLFVNAYSEQGGWLAWRIAWPAYGYTMELNITGLWPEGSGAPEVSPTEEQVRAIMQSIAWLDPDTWADALPESVVQADQRAIVVPQMLSDIPLPDGFDTAALIDGDTNDRYQLGAQVTAAVVCEWIDVWLAATDAGDNAGIDQAQSALAGARDWAVLQEMTASGAWSEWIWEYTDAVVAGDRGGVSGRESAIGCD